MPGLRQEDVLVPDGEGLALPLLLLRAKDIAIVRYPSKTLFNIARNILAVIGLAALAAVLYLANAWSFFNPGAWFNEEKVELRLSSPHEEYDAVVTIQEPGAFGSSWVRLYIVPAGVPFDKKSKEYDFEVLKSSSIMIDKLRWRDDRTLIAVRPVSGHIFRFDPIRYDQRDIAPGRPVQENWRRVTVLLQTDDQAFSPGGKEHR